MSCLKPYRDESSQKDQIWKLLPLWYAGTLGFFCFCPFKCGVMALFSQRRERTKPVRQPGALTVWAALKLNSPSLSSENEVQVLFAGNRERCRPFVIWKYFSKIIRYADVAFWFVFKFPFFQLTTQTNAYKPETKQSEAINRFAGLYQLCYQADCEISSVFFVSMHGTYRS